MVNEKENKKITKLVTKLNCKDNKDLMKLIEKLNNDEFKLSTQTWKNLDLRYRNPTGRVIAKIDEDEDVEKGEKGEEK